MNTKWEIYKDSAERQAGIDKLEKEQADSFGFSRHVLEYLYNKGARTLEDIEALTDISPDMERNPFDMEDVTSAAEIILEHISKKSKIIVFGDYDTDGVCSTSIMVRGLRELGGDVDYFVNNRFVHGYGINKKAVMDMMAEKGKPDLVVTVDNGIVGHEGIDAAREAGVDVVVTDHHLQGETLPAARAVVNPHRLDDSSKFKEICGATVAYKLLLVMFYQQELPFDFVYNMRDLVGLATVGDVMPLLDENRWFVQQGLELIGAGSRPQFNVLREVAQGDKPWNLNADLFGFLLSPIMNAPGRLEGTPNLAIDFFLTNDESEMKVLAEELVEMNNRRKSVATKQVELAETLVDVDESNVIIAYHPEFHEGIIGLIAGRLKERYYKPAIVFADGPDGTVKGSARSVDNYHIKEAFDRVSEHIIGHGGHAGAAGLSVKKADLDAFKEALNKDAECLSADDLKPIVKADAVLSATEVTEDLVAELDQLRPFGQGFRAPMFGLKGSNVKDVRFLTNGKHVKVTTDTGLDVMMFNGGEQVKAYGEFSAIKAIGSPSLNVYRGKTNVQFMVNGDCLVGY